MDGLWVDLDGIQIDRQRGHNDDRKGAQLVRHEVDTEGGHAGDTQVDQDIGRACIGLLPDLQSKSCGWGVCFSFLPASILHIDSICYIAKEKPRSEI